MLKPLTPKERETLSVLLAKIVLATFSWPAEGVPGLPPFPDDANSEPAAHDASAA